jgi:hypothetical protein
MPRVRVIVVKRVVDADLQDEFLDRTPFRRRTALAAS